MPYLPLIFCVVLDIILHLWHTCAQFLTIAAKQKICSVKVVYAGSGYLYARSPGIMTCIGNYGKQDQMSSSGRCRHNSPSPPGRYQMSSGGRCGYDRRRVAYMAGCGMGAGVLCHYWYLALDRWWVGRSVGVVAKKVGCY